MKKYDNNKVNRQRKTKGRRDEISKLNVEKKREKRRM